MAKSISQAQAEALSKGFFDSIGSNEGFEPVETLSTLIQLAGELVGTAQENLNASDAVATGALSESLKIINPELTGRQVRVDVEALRYYRYKDQGVKGTRKGSGKYRFRNENVGRNMLNAMRKWVIRENLKMRTTRKYSAISRRESKRKRITDTSYNTAYAISRSVKMKGIEKTMFFTNAVVKTQNRLKELAIPLKIDIINTLPKNINGNSNQ